jgi:hypothetical protein
MFLVGSYLELCLVFLPAFESIQITNLHDISHSLGFLSF